MINCTCAFPCGGTQAGCPCRISHVGNPTLGLESSSLTMGKSRITIKKLNEELTKLQGRLIVATSSFEEFSSMVSAIDISETGEVETLRDEITHQLKGN